MDRLHYPTPRGLLIVVLLVGVLLSGCNRGSSSAVRDQVLVYCSEASPESFNPQLVTSGPTFDASSRQLYNRLIEFELGTSILKPGLASRWEISKDGLQYTFFLRQGVSFHHTDYFRPNRTFNADDVIFSFQRQWKSSHPFHRVSQLSFRYFDTMGLKKLIKRLVKINDYEVRFILTRRDAPFLATLAMDFASILSKEYAEYLTITHNQPKIDTQPIGTGPFQLIRYQADAFIRYQANPNYWKGREPLAGLVFAITQNPSLRFARLIANECDLMASPLPTHVQIAKDYPQLRVLSEQGSNVAYLALNTNKKPFDNPLVRLALNYAVNKKALIKIVYNNAAVVAKNPIPPNLWSYNDNVKAIPFSLKKAKQLLTQAGYENGFNMELWAMPVQRSYNPNAIKMAELIQQDLAQIGVTAKIISYEFGTYLKKIKQGEHQAALLGWIGDNGDPDNFFTSLLSCAARRSGNNAAFWCNDEFDQLIRQAGIESDVKIRTKLYKEAQVIFSQANPWVPIAHSTQFVLANKRVKNFHLMPTGGMYFSGTSLRPSDEARKTSKNHGK